MFTKYASAQLLEAKMARPSGALMKDAHRHTFDYEPRPGYLYVRSRAISSRTNDNYDHFPAEEIKKAYKTFIGKPVFVNHNNENHRRARGVIVDAALHEDTNPDGSPDTWVEVLMEVDAVRFPRLAQAILAGEIDRTSMGTDVAFSVCSVCENRAETPLDYCKHIPAMKGMKVQRTTAAGTKEEVLVYEKCYGLGFFENSLLVEEPADPTAYFLGVDDRGLQGVAVTTSAKGGGGGTTHTASQWALAQISDNLARWASKTAVDEVKVPPQVDTLREENCPVCGEADSFDGETCLVCQYVKPPEQYMDPDLEKAKEIDLRQEEEAESISTEDIPGEDPLGEVEDAAEEVAAIEEEAEDAVAEVIGDEVIEQEPEEDPEAQEDVEEVAEIAEDVVDEAVDAEAEGEDPEEAVEEALDEAGEEETSEEGESEEVAPEQPTDEEPEGVEAEEESPEASPEGGGGVDPQTNADFEKLVEEIGLEDVEPQSDEDGGDDEEEEGDGEDGQDPPFVKDRKKKESRLKGRATIGGTDMGPALKALAAQDRQIATLKRQNAALLRGLKLIVRAAGIERDPRVVAILKAAADDGDNPGSPDGWATDNSGEEAPEATSEETLGFDNESEEPALPDDPEEQGSASESDTSADATTSLEDSGTVLDEPLDLEESDVTQPVAGTDDLGEGPAGQAGSGRTETEVRIDQEKANNPEVAFEETGWTESKRRSNPKVEARKAEGRVLASLRLARLRIQTGVEAGDDLAISSKIAASDMSNREIQREIETLSAVAKRQGQPQPQARPRNLVPRAAANTQRTVPSFQSGGGEPASLPQPLAVHAVSPEEILWD